MPTIEDEGAEFDQDSTMTMPQEKCAKCGFNDYVQLESGGLSCIQCTFLTVLILFSDAKTFVAYMYFPDIVIDIYV